MPHTNRPFPHFSELPLTLRVVYTGGLIVLGIGYIFAMVHIFFSHAGRDGAPGLSAPDLVIAYGGAGDESRLEAALKGSMSGMLPVHERAILIEWAQTGGSRHRYEATAEPILEKRCVTCHDGSNPHIASLTSYEEVARFVRVDTGMSVGTLVRASHIHLFGITFIFFLVGLVFAHARLRPPWLKAAIAGTPFALIVVDIGSWYLTKLYAAFAWVIIVSGGFMGAAFGAMWLVSMYQLWFYTPPESGNADREETM